MRGSLLLASGLLASSLLAFSATANADGYVSAGIGSDATLTGNLSERYFTGDDARNSRIAIGERFGAVGIEAVLFGSQLSQVATAEEATTVSLGIDAKYHIGLIGGLEAFGKIGLAKTWLTGEADADGVGTQMGLGLQYSFNIALTEIGLWADYTVQSTELIDSNERDLGGDLKMFNLGVSIGL